MAPDYFNSISTIFKCFRTQKVIVTQIVTTQYIFASLSLLVISQRPSYLSLPIIKIHD